MARSSCAAAFNLTLLLLLLSMGGSLATLSRKFYRQSCPSLFRIVRPLVKSALSREPRLGASTVRTFFHDCFVQGCDGSLLLDDTADFTGEKTALTNRNLISFGLIDEIKAEVEKVCPGVVSCADILTIAARDSVAILGGPSWAVKLGRRDSRTANLTGAIEEIPGNSSLNLAELISSFAAKHLSVTDMVALSGAHTIGVASCITFRERIYNATNIDSSFAELRRPNCPRQNGPTNGNVAPLDLRTPTAFDNSYFRNLLVLKGLLNSDQELFNGGSTDSLVETYSRSQSTFFSDFAAAMIRMGNISPLTGSHGEIRNNCRRIN